MNNFFRINVKTNEKSYAPYVVKSVSSQTAQLQDMSDSDVIATQKASRLPIWAQIISMLCFLTFTCLFCGILSAFSDAPDDMSMSEMWTVFTERGGIIMIVVGAVCLVASVVIFVWGRKRFKRVASSSQYQAVEENREKVQNDGYRELGVPTDADTIDVFAFPFKYNRKGKETQGSFVAKYSPVAVRIFASDDALYFADTSDLIKIPRSAVTGVSVITKRLNFSGWNKEQSFKSKEYKPYKIRTNNYGILFVKGCYSVKLLLGGEETEIIVPPYEAEILAKYIPL